MSDLYIELKKTINDLQEKLDMTKTFMEKVPKGYVTCEKCGNSVRYYHNQVLKKGKRVRKNIRKSNINLAKTLATKRYYEELIPQLEAELGCCRHLMRNIENMGKEKAFSKLSAYRKAILDPLYAAPDDNAMRWMTGTFSQKEMQPEVNSVKTRNGENVRSKSEKIIADELQSRGIPYRYECELKLKGISKPIYPDFTVMNKRTGKTFFWEHLGRMDDIEYYGNMVWRLDIYAKNGIYVGDKLLLTYETDYSPIRTELIDYIIENYLE